MLRGLEEKIRNDGISVIKKQDDNMINSDKLNINNNGSDNSFMKSRSSFMKSRYDN